MFIGHYAPEIASHLNETILHAPGEELSRLQSHLEKLSKLSENGKTAIFVGRQYLASPHRKAVLAELIKLKGSNENLTINIMEGRGNSLGARFAGVHPELGPFNEPLSEKGLTSIEILQTGAQTGWDYLHIASANPAAKMPKILWEKARKATKFLVVQDLFLTETAKNADVVLPTLCFFEKEGHFLSISGKIEQLNPGIVLPNGIYSDGQIFEEIAKHLDVYYNRFKFQRANNPQGQ
ncbi:MAG: molybdopterin-dependent oxidoreductase [Parachlamydiaceae bacterium]|nr:molybdopterin-dependent oxidoreductase [Parachlamydiaceae bacterium]